MKKLQPKHRYLLLCLINAFPFLLNVCCFQYGGMDDLFLFLPVLAVLVGLNYAFTDKTVHFLLFQGYLLAFLILSGYAETYLYYLFICPDDTLTLLVGMIMTFIGAIIAIAVSAAFAIVKAVKHKKANKVNF